MTRYAKDRSMLAVQRLILKLVPGDGPMKPKHIAENKYSIVHIVKY
jgi:hypothetical protein